MTKEELQSMPKWAGIYYFKNKINNKYYIGQTLVLRKRLLKHFYNWQSDQDYPIYHAFTKYGIDNFEVGILADFKSGFTKEELKSKLDELEIKYIEEFNSYGATGYNQTKGGDGGVLGYKMTEEQKETIQQGSLERASDGRFLVHLYDIEEHWHYTFINLRYAGEVLKVNYSVLRNSANLVRCGKYIIYENKEDLTAKLLKVNKNRSCKISEQEFLDVHTLDISIVEKCERLHICKKTYYNYIDRYIKK